MMYKDRKTETLSVGQRILNFDNTRSKATVVVALMAISVILLLVGKIVTFTEPRASVAVGFSGIQLLMFLFSGRSEYWFKNKVLNFKIHVPVFVSVVVLIFLLAILTVITLVVWFGLVKKKDIKLFGLGMLAIGVGFIVTFVLFIVSEGLRAQNRLGEDLAFYKVFDPSILLLLFAVLFIVLGTVQLKLDVSVIRKVKKSWFAYILLIVPTVLMLLFNYYPIFMQSIVSFKDYTLSGGIWGSEWVGLQWFKQIFSDKEILHVIGNSFYLAILRIVAGMVPPLLLALFLYDMAFQKMKAPFQTVLYIPHFFSWVVIYAVFYAVFANTGAINQVIRLITGSQEYVDFLTNPNNIVPIIILSQIWKEIGWGTILYLAALSSVDPSLFEAAALDGAGAFRKLWHVTIPGISSVIVFLLIMSLGKILNNGLEQIMLFANAVVRDKVYTIELWVYQQGLGKMQYGLSSAVGFFQSVMGLVLVLTSNWLSRRLAGRGLW